MDEKRVQWQQRYAQGGAGEAPAPAAVLLEQAHRLPPSGRALDLACGLGGNALLLAARGLETHAWDYAPAAIEQLLARARAAGA